jgi:hypothetical protein
MSKNGSHSEMIDTCLEYRLRNYAIAESHFSTQNILPTEVNAPLPSSQQLHYGCSKPVFQDSMHQSMDTTLQVIIISESVAVQWSLHLVKQNII